MIHVELVVSNNVMSMVQFEFWWQNIIQFMKYTIELGKK